jgi:hypothetical protein
MRHAQSKRVPHLLSASFCNSRMVARFSAANDILWFAAALP